MQINEPKHIVIMAGGTGGHVFPALAVAKELKHRGVAISWLGTAAGIEARLVPDAGIPLHYLTITGVRGKGFLTKLKAPLLLIKAVLQARKVLKQENADAVLGLGGFASGPGGVAAWTLGIPVLVHEQNAVAGTTNRYLAKIASRVMEAFPGSLPNAIHVGNPVREEIFDLPVSKNVDKPLKVLVLGGSLGALALNETVPQAIKQLKPDVMLRIKHQTGTKLLDLTRENYKDVDVEAEVIAFIDDMSAVYEWADLVICRAGALTVSELVAAGKPALLIPYPYAIDDHQTKNAQWLVDNDAGVLKQQHELKAQWLAEFIADLNENRQRLFTVANNAKQLSMSNATVDVATYCEEAANG